MKSTLYSCPISDNIEFSRQIFDKYPYIKFHENPSSRSRTVLCGQTGLPKLIVDFRNFANAPKNSTNIRQRESSLHRGEQMNTNDCLLCILSIRNFNTFQPFSWRRMCRSSSGENLTYHSGDSDSIPGEFAWDFSAIFSPDVFRPLLLVFWYEGYISDRL